MARSGNLATYSSGSKTVVLSFNDMLWAGRMLVGEGWKGGKGAAVLWSTLQRYFDTPHNFGSYANFIRAFSQPINPEWLPGGTKFEQAKKYKKQVYKRATSAAAVKRRTRIQKIEWRDLPIKVQQLVGNLATGKLPRPKKFGGKRFNNFASYEGVSNGRPGGVWYGGEYFFKDLKNKRIAINGSIPSTGGSQSGGGLILAAAAAIGALVLFRKK